MRRILPVLAASLIVGAGLVSAPAQAATVTDQAVIVLGNSPASNVDLVAFHRSDCTGPNDVVSPGEISTNAGSEGSVRIEAGWHGSASPWYTIHRKDHAWCWKTPTAVHTSVYLRR
jgi:hypothetical protein